MDQNQEIIEVAVDDLCCSSVYLDEEAVDRMYEAYGRGRDKDIPPVKVYRHQGFDQVIWEGHARVYVARMLGRETVPAVTAPSGEPGEDQVVRGLRAALARGIRSVRDFTPYHLRPADDRP